MQSGGAERIFTISISLFAWKEGFEWPKLAVFFRYMDFIRGTHVLKNFECCFDEKIWQDISFFLQLDLRDLLWTSFSYVCLGPSVSYHLSWTRAIYYLSVDLSWVHNLSLKNYFLLPCKQCIKTGQRIISKGKIILHHNFRKWFPLLQYGTFKTF